MRTSLPSSSQFQSTLPARGSDYIVLALYLHLCLISIHAPRKGERLDFKAGIPLHRAISIHAPRKGERLSGAVHRCAVRVYFNPRSPQGGATGSGGYAGRGQVDFNPRSPQGGATSPSISMASSKSISIHAPRKGERLVVQPLILACYIFQSTLPARGSDLFDHEFIGFLIPHFNPRSPQGGATRFRVCYRPAWLNFNPRSPQGGATDSYQDSKGNLHHFNPRSPQGGATISIFVNNSGQVDFNPRSPQGGATTTEDKSSLVAAIFQSTLPARGSDSQQIQQIQGRTNISIHAPRKGERQNPSNAIASLS